MTTDMEVYREEIFGPVLSVVRVESYDEAVALVNANEYGNGTAIFTNDGGAARRFENDVEVGMIGVNVPIPVPVAYYSFGGWKTLALRRHPRLRHRGRALLHPRQGRHHPVDRPGQPPGRRPRAGIPAECLSHAPYPARSTPTRRGPTSWTARHVFHSWSAQATLDPMVITKAEGSYVWDGEGNRLLDFTSQLVYTNLGHQHPRIVAGDPGAGRHALHGRPGLRQRRPAPRPRGSSPSTPPAT